MGSYNSFFWPLVMIKSEHLYTLPIGLLYFDSSAGQETNLLMAAVTMSVAPNDHHFRLLAKTTAEWYSNEWCKKIIFYC
jgi:multiple sugar transport system permease protein